MAVFVDLKAEPRNPAKNRGTGTRVSRRLRAQGRIPGIIYGHNLASQPIHMARDEFWGLFKIGSPLVKLHMPGATEPENVLVRDIQWDYLGKEVVHVDFARIDMNEVVRQVVPITLKGDAPGTAHGGILEHLMHEVAIHCLAVAIPESIVVDVSRLEVDEQVEAKDLSLPDGAKLDVDGSLVVVHVTRKRGSAAAEPEAEPDTPAES